MDTEVTPTRCRVVVKPVFQMRSGVLRRWKDVNAPVQNRPFRFKLRVTNVDNIPFPRCTISNIQVTDTSHVGGVNTAFIGKFNIPTLNPRQSHEVVVDETAVLTQEGSCWIRYVVEPIDGSQALVCQTTESEGSVNKGRYVVVVQRAMERQQRTTNRLLVTIAALHAIDCVSPCEYSTSIQ